MLLAYICLLIDLCSSHFQNMNTFIVLASFLLIIHGVTIKVCNGTHDHDDDDHHHDHHHHHDDGLTDDFYKKSCSQIETIVRNIVRIHVQNNPSLPAKLLRMHFHDCFVRGCDGSVLLDPVGTNRAEKDAIPNLSLSGFEVIDVIKGELERTCRGKVSCADILALAARDAIFVSQGHFFEVLTGRRDGSVSLESEALNLPSPFANFSTLLQRFVAKGLDLTDLVALSGAHTIGVAHCAAFSNRLYNFMGGGGMDPFLDPIYAATLKIQCPNPANPTTTVEMDPNSSLQFDANYFRILRQNKGLFQSDAALLTDPQSAILVEKYQSFDDFFHQFKKSMKKMGAIGVLTGRNGEIRRNCRVINSN